MRHYGHLEGKQLEALFYIMPASFMISTPKEQLSYALGATLYIPAVHEKLYDYLITRKYISLTTLVICLEDGIADKDVERAEFLLEELGRKLAKAIEEKEILQTELPLLFIRTRSTAQLEKILKNAELMRLITGFTLPKFNSIEGERQLMLIEEAALRHQTVLYGMPILETKALIDYETSYEELMALKAIILKHKDYVLNVRIGATDFTGLFGIRRTIDSTIYDITVIRECIGHIINVFGKAEYGMTISGPVWEFFSNHSRLLKPELRQTPFRKYGQAGAEIRSQIVSKAEDGLIKEVILDKVNGLIGKTIIHPSHIRLVNALQVVTKEEYEDASQILNTEEAGVIKSKQSNKMNEVKPHTNWAHKVMKRASIYGVINEDEDYTALF